MRSSAKIIGKPVTLRSSCTATCEKWGSAAIPVPMAVPLEVREVEVEHGVFKAFQGVLRRFSMTFARFRGVFGWLKSFSRRSLTHESSEIM